jgi:hypothetical protein
MKPIAKTDSCQAVHMGYFVSGRMKVVMDDGEEMEFGPGISPSCHPVGFQNSATGLDLAFYATRSYS